jgi:NAD dependent epimerase/dehydratase family enzyme
MIIAISGSGGFIGKKCTSYFAEKGWLVKAIPRISAGTETGFLAEVLGDADVVLNLSGATIARRWSKTYMKII